MTLGWKPALTNEVYEPFMRSGTMHIFAISGLHIALIAGILAGLLRMFQVPRIGCGWVVIPLIWFYTAATGWQPSAIRSTVMMSIIIGGWALKRPSDLVNSLAAAAFIILLWDPQQIFGASFQLSFLVVLSIALLVPPLDAARDRLLRTDPLLPAELLPRWRRWLETPLRWVTTSLAVSLAAWLGSLPLTAYYFHLLSPVTLLANLCIVPLEQPGAGGQPRQPDLRRLAAVGHGMVQPQRLVVDAVHGQAQRLGHASSRSLLVCPGAFGAGYGRLLPSF